MKTVRYYHLIAALALFFVFDRALYSLVPDFYREHADHERVINEYHTYQYLGARDHAESIRAIVLGDSRTRYGVDPSFMTAPGVTRAHNLAIDGAGVDTVARQVPVLVKRFPRLEWLVWGVSPRIFNVAWKDRAAARVAASDGFRRFAEPCAPLAYGCNAERAFDVVMSGLSSTYAARSIVQPVLLDRLLAVEDGRPRFRALEPVPMNAHGFMALPRRATVDTSDAKRVAKYARSHKRGWFRWNDSATQTFEQILEDVPKHVRVVLFVPPMHAVLASLPTADHDATPDESYADITAYLHDVADRMSNVQFRDLNRDGNNVFDDSHWGNFDHLNPAGAKILTQQLMDVIANAKRS